MILLAGLAYLLFGVFSIVGGVVGFKKAKSRASLIAGGGAGVVLLSAAASVLSGNTTLGLAVGGVTSLLLGVRFIPGYLKTKKMMPQGIMAGLSAFSLVATALAHFS
jgi:uncharacterized membrane protein (UPF0136 family)